MKTIFDFDKPIQECNIEELKRLTRTEIQDKNKILKYLKSFDDVAFTSAPAIDKFTSIQVLDADNAKTDTEYIWNYSDIYHFEKYDLKLSDDFINHVLAKTK